MLVELGPQHRTMMMLAVAFSANIGGTATLIGTPPNLIMYEYLSAYPGHPVTFGAVLVTTRAANESPQRFHNHGEGPYTAKQALTHGK